MGNVISFKETCCSISNCGNKELSETKSKPNTSKSITKCNVMTSEYSITSISSSSSSIQKNTTKGCDELDKGRQQEINALEEENQKLKDIINTMTQQMDEQKLENDTLSTRVNEYKQSQIQHNKSVTQNDNDNDSNANVISIEEKKELDLLKIVTDDRVIDTLGKTRDGVPIRQIVLNQYKTIDVHVDNGDIESEVELTDEVETDSSYEEDEKLEIEKRKSLVRQKKSLNEEAIAMQTELQEMQTMSEEPLKNKPIHTTPSNLVRDISDEWSDQKLSAQKKEMEEHMIHLISSQTKCDTPKNENNDNSSS